MERITIVGTLQRNNSPHAATITFELPNKVKVDPGGGQTIGFGGNGSSPWDGAGGLNADDHDLLEALSDDAPETFFYNAAAQTYRLRALVHHARMDDDTSATYAGPWGDIYQEIGVTEARGDSTTRVKHFYFDSVTHLPMRVRYLTATGSRIEVIRSQWTQVQGQYIALKIERYQDGNLTHSFTGTSVAIAAAANDGTFSH